MRRVLVLLLALFLLSSCSKEGFDIDSISLARSIYVEIDENGIVQAYKESLILRAVFSNEDYDYSFQLKSPDGDLMWEGSFNTDSVALGITDGAMLPDGDYHAIFYSDNGNEKKEDLYLSPVDISFPYITKANRLSARKGASIVEYDEDGNELRRDDNADSSYYIDSNTYSVLINSLDRYQNSVSVRQMIR